MKASPEVGCGTPQVEAGQGSVRVRRPICGSHRHCHLQGCSPQESLRPHPCLRQSPSPRAEMRGVRRYRLPCSVPPSPAPGNTCRWERTLKIQALTVHSLPQCRPPPPGSSRSRHTAQGPLQGLLGMAVWLPASQGRRLRFACEKAPPPAELRRASLPLTLPPPGQPGGNVTADQCDRPRCCLPCTDTDPGLCDP